MKKVTINYLALMIATAFVAGGCNSLQKMADNAELVERTVSPNPLEMHAGKVPVSISVNFPAKYFHKKAYLVFTPVLKSETTGDSINMRSATLQGEKVKDNNPVISYKTGGSYSYQDTIAYSDPYRVSDLRIAIKATKDGESVNVMSMKVADGVNVTPLLVEQGLKVDNGTVGDGGAGVGRTIDAKVAKPTSSETSKDLTVYYPMQKAALDKNEQKKSDIKTFVSQVNDVANDEKIKLKSVQVSSYASPDGPEDLNSNLVESRGKNSVSFVKDQLKKVNGTQGSDFIQTQTTAAEDWEGFKKQTEASDLKDKDLILRVLSMYSDPTVREREIKNISEAYKGLKSDILPKLRRSEIKAICLTPEKTEAEIADLAANNPDELTQDEALYASISKNTTDAQKENVLKNYVSRFPNDWRGYNNLGNLYIKENKLSDAETNLTKANSIDANQAAVYNNLGVLYQAKGDDAKAKEYFQKAKNMGNEEAGYNLGVINIREGEYSKAVSNFGSQNTFNKALAQTLNKDYSSSNGTINNVESNDGWVSYLKAINAARQDNESDVMSNLKAAVNSDSSIKAYAKDDVEFIKYFDNDSFKAIVD